VKRNAIAGSLALVHPSYFESFSMILTETWALSRPALVQGRCAVLAGQVSRSGGGISYRGYAEFEAAVDLLLENRDLGEQLGRLGRSYVERTYEWDKVLSRYEEVLAESEAIGAR
jgi:glycosyltransferase involved in cell wall biosynthesis